MLTPVPNSTLWIDTQKERKKSDSPRTFWYETRLNPTGQKDTRPALTASLLLRETHITEAILLDLEDANISISSIDIEGQTKNNLS